MHIERGLNYCNLPFAQLKLRNSARLHFISVCGCVLCYVCKLNLSSWLVAQSRRMQKVIYRTFCRSSSDRKRDLLYLWIVALLIIVMLIPARCNLHKNTWNYILYIKYKGREADQFHHIETRNLLLYWVPSKRRPIKRSHILIMWTDNKIHIQAAAQLLTKNSVIHNGKIEFRVFTASISIISLASSVNRKILVNPSSI